MFQRIDKAGSGTAVVAIFFLTLLLAGLAYMPGLSGPFILDDGPNILQNPLLRIDGTEPDDWRTAATSGSSGPLGRPVAMLSFAVNHALANNFSAFGMKLFNLGLHLAMGCLVYVFLRLALATPAFDVMPQTHRSLVPMLAAFLWLLHPLHVSTVLYVVQRMAMLSALFTLAGLVVYLRYRLRWLHSAITHKEIIDLISWLCVFAALAILSKENGALFLPLLVLCEMCLFGRRSFFSHQPLIRPIIVLAITSLLPLGLLFHDSLTDVMSSYRDRDFTLFERLLTQGRVLWHYVAWLVFPHPDSLGLYHDDIAVSRGLLNPLSTLLALAGWVFAASIAFVYRLRFPLIVFGLSFYLIGHALESSFLPLEIAFEHRNYLPSIGVLVLFAWMLVRLGEHMGSSRRILFALVVGLMTALLTWRAFDWRDEYSLVLRQAEAHEESPRSQIAIAQVLLRKLAESDSMGLDDLSDSIAGQARVRLERAHALVPGGIAAPVLMLSLQSRWPEADIDADKWFRLILAGAPDARHAADLAAFRRLIDCATENTDVCQLDKVDSVIGQLTQGQRSGRYARLHYEWLLEKGASPDVRMASLDRSLSLAPHSTWANTYKLQEALATGDVNQMYQAAIDWYASDRERRRLPLIEAAFEAAP